MDRLIEYRTTVISTSSVTNERYGNLDLADLENEKNYSAVKAYGDARLAQILFTKGLDRRFGERGVAAVSFHPGIIGMNFASDSNSFFRLFYYRPLKYLLTASPEKGADTLVWLSEATPDKDWKRGGYYVNRKAVPPNKQADDPALGRCGRGAQRCSRR